jgi:murein DD-endopeptidase MepM/ murein hydrolase activator NlpD
MAAKPTCVRGGFTFALMWFFILLEMAFLAPAFCRAPLSDPGWQRFERQVRDGEISFSEGQKAIAAWAERLEREFPKAQSQPNTFFPLKGYSIKDVGGKNGDGYKPQGYRFLDGNRHLGHPAQDIFVRDRNQDGIDDLTGKPVEVLALTEGVVVSTFSEWKGTNPFRELRGGNYVWVYHPALKALSYYAHLGRVFVRTGDRVRGGEALATLGRSGKNASLPRSPTHLHLMILSSGTMEPLNPFPLLRSSRGSWSLQRRALPGLQASASVR